MGARAEVGLLIGFALLAANLPFLTERLFLVGPRRSPKPLPWRLAELALGALLALGLGLALEAHRGQRHPQGWEFHVAAVCLFLTLAFPGFVWRHLRRQGGRD